jgi:DNA polymerase gamma 1
MLIPSDVQYVGTLTGRTSGLVTTLPNPSDKKLRKIGATVKNHVHFAPPGLKVVGFDFTALEMAISSAYAAKEYCARNGLMLDPLALEINKLVFLGESTKGTDIHSVVAKQVGVPRRVAKTYGFATLYGSSLKGLESVARPELPSYTPEQLTQASKEFLLYFKGTRIRGTNYWADGLFSHFFNYTFNLISQSVPRLPFLGTAITTALRPEAVGKDYLTGRMNWAVQASAGEMHDMMLILVNRAATAAGFKPTEFRFYCSIHDQLDWLVAESRAKEFGAIIKECHAKCWTMFFQALGFEDAPEIVKTNIVVNIDYCSRKEVTDLYPSHVDYLNLPPEALIPNGLNM